MRVLACLGFVALAACDQGAKPKDPVVVAFERLEYFTARMCDCRDSKCVQRVSDEMAAWSQEWGKTHREPPKISDAETKRATALGERMAKCMQTAMSADLGLTLTEVDPTSADTDGGTTVHIRGSGFTQDVSRTTVYFGDKQGHVIRYLSDSVLVVATPRGVTGTVDVKVIFDPGGEKVLPGAFTFVAGK